MFSLTEMSMLASAALFDEAESPEDFIVMRWLAALGFELCQFVFHGSRVVMHQPDFLDELGGCGLILPVDGVTQVTHRFRDCCPSRPTEVWNPVPSVAAEQVGEIGYRAAEGFLEHLLSRPDRRGGGGSLLNRDQTIPGPGLVGGQAGQIGEGLFRRGVVTKQARDIASFVVEKGNELDIFRRDGRGFHRESDSPR